MSSDADEQRAVLYAEHAWLVNKMFSHGLSRRERRRLRVVRRAIDNREMLDFTRGYDVTPQYEGSE